MTSAVVPPPDNMPGTHTVNVLLKPLFDDSAAEELAHYAELSSLFQQQTGIHINVDLEPPESSDPMDYFSTIDPIISRQTATWDIIAIDSAWVAQWPDMFTNQLQPELSSAETEQAIRDRTFAEDPAYLTTDAAAGALVALPMWADYGVVLARKDLLDKYNISLAGSFAEMNAACLRIMASEAQRDLQCFVGGMDGSDVVELFAEWIYTNNSTPLIQFGQQPSFDTTRNRELIGRYQTWIQNNNFISQRAQLFDSGAALSVWLAGGTIFYRGRASVLLRTYQAWANKTYRLALLSGNNPGAISPMASVQGGFHLAMTKSGNQNDTEVALALLFLTGETVQKARALKFGAPPTLASLNADPQTCTAINCTLLANLAPFDLPSTFAAPLWVDAVSAMAPYFTGIINGSYDSATGLSLATTAVLAAFIAGNASPSSGGLSVTAVILLSVLLPIIAIALAIGAAICCLRRRKARTAKNTSIQEEIAIGTASTALPPVTEPKHHGAFSLFMRPARRPDATNAADLQRRATTSGVLKNPPPLVASSGDSALTSTNDNSPRPSGRGQEGGKLVPAPARMIPEMTSIPPVTSKARVPTVALTGKDSPAPAAPAVPPVAWDYDPTPRGRSHDYAPVDDRDHHHHPHPHQQPTNNTRNRGSRSGRSNSSGDRRFTVIHPYNPLVGDELELRPNDVVSVRLAYDDGYAFGYNEATSTAGVFPLACLLPVGMEVGLPSRLESGADNSQTMQHGGDWEHVDSLEMLLLSGRITEGTYLALRREQEEELRTQRQITALRERLAVVNLDDGERKKLQSRLDALELGDW
ncbi:hypothetical protein HKX48_000001 [Thoreauomyces humboldtii]|nr:hypothetical protein HKX48_000001 [Thoreauomyces humboldtii]